MVHAHFNRHFNRQILCAIQKKKTNPTLTKMSLSRRKPRFRHYYYIMCMPSSPAFPSAVAEYVFPRFENNEMSLFNLIKIL